jgi:hypothetical protein
VFHVSPKYKFLLNVFLVELIEIAIFIKFSIPGEDSPATPHLATAHHID